MEENEHIYKHIKDSLENYVLQPKVTSFDEILRRVEEKRKRRFLFFLFPGLILIVAGLFFLFGSETPSREISVMENQSAFSKYPEEKAADKLVVDGGEKERKPVNKQASGNASSALPGREPAVVKQDALPAPKKRVTINQSMESVDTGNQDALNAAAAPSELSGAFPESDSHMQADILSIKPVLLPAYGRVSDLVMDSLKISELPEEKRESSEKDKLFRYFAGIDFQPQATAFHFLENSQRNSNFDNNAGEPYSAVYLRHRKKENAVNFNYSYGLKLGLVWRDRYEVIIGAGFQRFKGVETYVPVPVAYVNSVVNNNLPNFYPSGLMSGQDNSEFVNMFRYRYYSLELGRYLNKSYFTRVKIAAGIQVNHITKSTNVYHVSHGHSHYESMNYYSVYNRFNYAVNLKIGFVQDLSRRLQIQFCPTVFYSINSMFARDYILKQKNLGAGLQALLLFKIG